MDLEHIWNQLRRCYYWSPRTIKLVATPHYFNTSRIFIFVRKRLVGFFPSMTFRTSWQIMQLQHRLRREVWRTLAKIKGQLAQLLVRRHFATRCVRNLCKCTLRAYWILLALELASSMFYELLKQRFPLKRLRVFFRRGAVISVTSCERMTCKPPTKAGMAQLLSQKCTLAYKGKPALIPSVFNTAGYMIRWFSICEPDHWKTTVVRVHLDALGWELLPGGAAVSLNIVTLLPLLGSKEYNYRRSKLLKAINLKRKFCYG